MKFNSMDWVHWLLLICISFTCVNSSSIRHDHFTDGIQKEEHPNEIIPSRRLVNNMHAVSTIMNNRPSAQDVPITSSGLVNTRSFPYGNQNKYGLYTNGLAKYLPDVTHFYQPGGVDLKGDVLRPNPLSYTGLNPSTMAYINNLKEAAEMSRRKLVQTSLERKKNFLLPYTNGLSPLLPVAQLANQRHLSIQNEPSIAITPISSIQRNMSPMTLSPMNNPSYLSFPRDHELRTGASLPIKEINSPSAGLQRLVSAFLLHNSPFANVTRHGFHRHMKKTSSSHTTNKSVIKNNKFKSKRKVDRRKKRSKKQTKIAKRKEKKKRSKKAHVPARQQKHNEMMAINNVLPVSPEMDMKFNKALVNKDSLQETAGEALQKNPKDPNSKISLEFGDFFAKKTIANNAGFTDEALINVPQSFSLNNKTQMNNPPPSTEEALVLTASAMDTSNSTYSASNTTSASNQIDKKNNIPKSILTPDNLQGDEAILLKPLPGFIGKSDRSAAVLTLDEEFAASNPHMLDTDEFVRKSNMRNMEITDRTAIMRSTLNKGTHNKSPAIIDMHRDVHGATWRSLPSKRKKPITINFSLRNPLPAELSEDNDPFSSNILPHEYRSVVPDETVNIFHDADEPDEENTEKHLQNLSKNIQYAQSLRGKISNTLLRHCGLIGKRMLAAFIAMDKKLARIQTTINLISEKYNVNRDRIENLVGEKEYQVIETFLREIFRKF